MHLRQQLAAAAQPDAYVIDSQWLRDQTTDMAAAMCKVLEDAGFVRAVSTSTRLIYTLPRSGAAARQGALVSRDVHG